jgi:hypothetical protein
MNRHLTPSQFVQAAEDTLDARGAAHLGSCDECRQTVDGLRAALLDAAGVDVPEPSPLFWNGFSARVRAATAEVPAPRAWWKPASWIAIGSLSAAAIVLAVSLRTPPGDRSPSIDSPAAEGWTEVVQLAAQLSLDDVEQLAESDTTLLIEDLTPDEQAIFVQLLERELERTE